jgi:hypothetical protein
VTSQNAGAARRRLTTPRHYSSLLELVNRYQDSSIKNAGAPDLFLAALSDAFASKFRLQCFGDGL